MNDSIDRVGNTRSKLVIRATHCALIVATASLLCCLPVSAQKRKSTTKAKSTQAKPVDELARLRDEFVKATNDYKASLEKLLASYEKNVAKAQTRLTESKELLAQGLISKNDVEASERILAEANDRVAETRQRMNSADAQIADTLVEAEAEKSLAKSKPMAKGSLLKTAAYIRYNGGTAWALSDAWKVQRFFLDTFKKPLPIAVFGQGAIHDRWRLDHHNAMDVSLHPDGAEGQALLSFLRSNGIPFLAFRQAIPGTATGPHIHIGRPSHRY
jgi:ribosome-binding protein aMBF1 (putative translation factor)